MTRTSMNGEAKHYSLDQICDEKRTLFDELSETVCIAANSYSRGVLRPSKYAKMRLSAGTRWGNLRRSTRPPSRMGKGYPSPYQPTRRFLCLDKARPLDFGGGALLPKYIFIEPPLTLTGQVCHMTTCFLWVTYSLSSDTTSLMHCTDVHKM